MGRLSVFSQALTYIMTAVLCVMGNSALGSPYVYHGESTVPIDRFQYLENIDRYASISDLSEANWKDKVENIHSYYNGFWVKLSVLNKSGETDLGVSHWTTFEKKLFAFNSSGIQEYDYISFYDNSYSFMGIDRIQFRYRVLMPIDEVTEIYSYYKFQPLHRTLSTRHEIFGISTW